VWIWLRPGLALEDLLNRLDKIAVACWASSVLAETAAGSNTALVRVDIKRREVLGETITSPLLRLIKGDTPVPQRDPAEVPTALDLPQVTASEVTPPAKPTPIRRHDTPKTPTPAPPPAPPAGIPADIADWIDP